MTRVGLLVAMIGLALVAPVLSGDDAADAARKKLRSFSRTDTVAQSGNTDIDTSAAQISGQPFAFATVGKLRRLTRITITAAIVDGDTGPGEDDEDEVTLVLDGIDTGIRLNGFRDSQEDTLTVSGVPANRSQHRERHVDEQRHDLGISAEAKGKGRKKGGKTRTVTRTFANGGAIEIVDNDAANPYPATIAANGFKRAKITDVNLTLRGVSHEFPSDINVLLVAPGDRNALLVSDVGIVEDGEPVTDLTLTLDDEAPASLPAEEELTSGTFQPLDNDINGDIFPAPAPAPSENSALSTFDGINPDGKWRLFVADDAVGETGSIAEGWSLEITAKSKKKRR